jgi:DNA-binding transcriptional MocR family regulator
MRPFRLYSAVEQVTQHLREELHSGLWREVLPGVNRLAAELGVNHKTVEAAVRQLEQEGLLQKPGHRRSRLIGRCGQKAKNPLRVVILPGEASDLKVHYMVELRHALLEAGHGVNIASRSLNALGMQVRPRASCWRASARKRCRSSPCSGAFAGCRSQRPGRRGRPP